MASITAVSAAIPNNKLKNDFFSEWHDHETVKTALNLVGVDERYWANRGISSLRLNVSAASALLDKTPLDTNLNGTLREHIDILVFVTQTPDCSMPGMAYKAHKELNLPDTCRCISVNAGCSGYVENISLAMDLLAQCAGKYALVLVGDVLSQHIDPRDRSTALIFGDAGTATLISNCSAEHRQNRHLFTGGSRSNGNAYISLPLSSEDNNYSPRLYMDGLQVFNFTISQIPTFVQDVQSKWFSTYGESADPDYFFLHQANKTILERVRKKLKIEEHALPINIGKYGNTSGASIPLLMVDLLNNGANLDNKKLLLCGFGVGLGWGSLITETTRIYNAGIVVCENKVG